MKTHLPPIAHQEINKLLKHFVNAVIGVLDTNILGVYLFGSLTYDAFDFERSDIDLVVFVHRDLTPAEIKKVETLHHSIEDDFQDWQTRIEASYTPTYMLSEVLPPKQPRPYWGGGIMWAEAHYGHEWIINLYLMKQYGITLYGRDLHEIVGDIDTVEVQKASVRDLFKEWEPKLSDPEWLDNSHYQSYLVLNLCRILYTVENGEAHSKNTSAYWVKQTFPEWLQLIDAAQAWGYGDDMQMQQVTLDFLRFVIQQVKKSDLFRIAMGQ